MSRKKIVAIVSTWKLFFSLRSQLSVLAATSSYLSIAQFTYLIFRQESEMRRKKLENEIGREGK